MTALAVLFVLVAGTAVSAQHYASYYTTTADYRYYRDDYYVQYHHDDCEMVTPKGLYVPSMCLLYLAVNECPEKYDPHILSEYREFLHEILPEEEIYYVDEMWDSPYGPGGELAQSACGEMGYDIHYLNHYAVCLEHLFGIGFDASNAAYLQVNITAEIPEIVWDWHAYYYYNPEYSVGPALPHDPIQQIRLILHGIALEHLSGYNKCLHGDYMCSDGTCIMDYWKCDGYADCTDGSDEMFCPTWDDYSWYRDDYNCDDDFWSWYDHYYNSDWWYLHDYDYDDWFHYDNFYSGWYDNY